MLIKYLLKETPMNIPFNNDWLFHKQFEESMLASSYSTNHMQRISIPHTCTITPYHYFDESIYQMVSGYRKVFVAPKKWKNSRVFLNFDGALHSSHVYLNGHLVGSHHCGYTAFTIELTKFLHFELENILVVSVDSHECNNIPPFGNVIDYMTYGGIYREVSLEVKPPIYIEDVFVQTTHVLRDEKQLAVEITLNALVNDLTISYALASALTPQTEESQVYEPLGTTTVTEHCTKVTEVIKDVALWSIEEPNLYWLRVELYKNDILLDTKEIRFGFREVAFQCNGFYLNGELVKLIGLNRHQSYPYVGYAMPKRVQQLDADILKNELSLNAVRTSHYPQSQHFIDRCDEIGLLVFTEIVGWQHIGDSHWKDIAIQTTQDMVVQYRNHPSVIIWGVRINESQDDDLFYSETNRIAHKLDPSRATGGVRFITKSNLLEDVYTFNDFSHTGDNAGTQPKDKVTSNCGKPYLITEYNGHMFPTKSFDNESHRLEHALRHANVLQGIWEDPDILGGFGWCMVDYNTHKDFGSGDRICYHGVMTMFRNPKLAASVYASQTNNAPFLTISSTMNIGEYPGGNLSSLYAFTNADSIRLYKNGSFVKEFYPNRTNYGALPHPPILIDDFIGELIKVEGYSTANEQRIKDVLLAILKYGQNHLPFTYKVKMGIAMLQEKLTMEDGIRLYSKYIGNWGDEATAYRFDAIQNGQVIHSVHKQSMTQFTLHVNSDTHTLLEADTYDVATIRIHAIDEYGEILPYYHGVLSIQVEGELALIGPSHISMQGGTCGTYVKTIGKSGTGSVTIYGEGTKPITIDYTIKKLCVAVVTTY